MQNEILPQIDAFLKTHGMAESTFGREAAGDWKLLNEMRGVNRPKPRRLWPETEDKIRAFMLAYRPAQATA